jgi:hypothetical protein
MAEKLTARKVRSTEDAVTLWDTEVKGFGIRIYPTGGKSFFINYRIGGRERRYAIGAFPTWSVEAARERAKELRKLIDAGRDPAEDNRERREAPTIADLIERYVTEHLPRKIVGPARQNDEKRMLAEIGKHLGKHTKVSDIHDGDVRKMHADITASGRRVRANRILAVASKMFSLSLTSMAGENRPWRGVMPPWETRARGLPVTARKPGSGSSAKPSSPQSPTRSPSIRGRHAPTASGSSC